MHTRIMPTSAINRGLPPVIVALTTLSLLGASGCRNAAADFEKAQEEDTPGAYSTFLEQHPDSEHAAAARERWEYLKNLAAMARVLESDDAVEQVKAMAAIKGVARDDKLHRLIPLLIRSLSDQRMVTITEGVTFVNGLMVVTGEGGGSMRYVTVGGEAAAALEHITGESYGKDKDKWTAWWNARDTGGGG